MRATKEQIEAWDKAGEKPCTKCGLILPLSKFYKVKGQSEVRRAMCKKCIIATQRKNTPRFSDQYIGLVKDIVDGAKNRGESQRLKAFDAIDLIVNPITS